jgi:hypothetical protein
MKKSENLGSQKIPTSIHYHFHSIKIYNPHRVICCFCFRCKTYQQEAWSLASLKWWTQECKVSGLTCHASVCICHWLLLLLLLLLLLSNTKDSSLSPSKWSRAVLSFSREFSLLSLRCAPLLFQSFVGLFPMNPSYYRRVAPAQLIFALLFHFFVDICFGLVIQQSAVHVCSPVLSLSLSLSLS